MKAAVRQGSSYHYICCDFVEMARVEIREEGFDSAIGDASFDDHVEKGEVAAK
jgi:hypothetical protein